MSFKMVRRWQHFSLEELSREIVSVREGLDAMSENK